MKIRKPSLLLVACVLLWSCYRSVSAPNLATLDSTALQQILKNVERKVPALELANTNALQTAWQGQALAKAYFVLGKDKSFPPADHQLIGVVIARYASSEEAQKSLEESLGFRPAVEPVRKSYNGAWLYQYTYGGENAICQAQQYIVEIEPQGKDAKPFTMQILDVILAELASAPAIEH